MFSHRTRSCCVASQRSLWQGRRRRQVMLVGRPASRHPTAEHRLPQNRQILIEDTNTLYQVEDLLGDANSLGISVAACCNVCDAQSSYQGHLLPSFLLIHVQQSRGKLKCPTAGGTEICLCIEVVQRSNLYFGFDHSSQFH